MSLKETEQALRSERVFVRWAKEERDAALEYAAKLEGDLEVPRKRILGPYEMALAEMHGGSDGS
jgi:hypothetical protein